MEPPLTHAHPVGVLGKRELINRTRRFPADPQGAGEGILAKQSMLTLSEVYPFWYKKCSLIQTQAAKRKGAQD